MSHKVLREQDCEPREAAGRPEGSRSAVGGRSPVEHGGVCTVGGHAVTRGSGWRGGQLLALNRRWLPRRRTISSRSASSRRWPEDAGAGGEDEEG